MGLLDALGYVGDALAKPGRAVRGLLAGRPGELANLLPFSDTMGLTDPTQQVHGRDLLQQWGMANQGDEDMGASLAGFGVDVATDPLTWLGGAALAGGAKLLGKTNPGRLGAVAGSDAAHGFFPLTDPIERLIPESEHALRVARGATSEWAPLADDLHPVPGQPEFAPKMTPMGDEIPPYVPGPIGEPFSADRAGYMLAYGPGYQKVGEKYGLAGPWESSIPTEMAQDGFKHAAMRTHMDEWNKVLDDFDRLTPEARAQMGFPRNDGMDFELSLQDEINQLSPHAAPWQSLLGIRHAELGPMRELAIRGVLPHEFADDLARQHERIQPLLDRWSDGSPLANKMTQLLDEGTVMPSNVGDLIHGSSWEASKIPSGQVPFGEVSGGWKPGVLNHLPVDERALRALAASRHRDAILENLTGELDNFGNRFGGLTLADLSQDEPASIMLDRLRTALDTQRWSTRGYEGGVFNQLVRHPQQFAGEYANMIEDVTRLLPQLEARAAAATDPGVAAQLAEIVGTVRQQIGGNAHMAGDVTMNQAIQRAGATHMSPLLERLNLNSFDASQLAGGMPEEDQAVLQWLLRYHMNPPPGA